VEETAALVGMAKQEFWMQKEGNTGCVREVGKQPAATGEREKQQQKQLK